MQKKNAKKMQSQRNRDGNKAEVCGRKKNRRNVNVNGKKRKQHTHRNEKKEEGISGGSCWRLHAVEEDSAVGLGGGREAAERRGAAQVRER